MDIANSFKNGMVRQTLPEQLTLSFWPMVALLFTIIAVYITGLFVHRLYFSPLANFPGPKLAALTGWYETYFEIVKRGGGQFTFEIRRLHKQYAILYTRAPLARCVTSGFIAGPIVRINPNELHIHDAEYYETIYTSSLGFDKSAHVQNRFGAPQAAFSTPDHDVHRRRRAAILPFFAKRKIYEQALMIQGQVDKICHRLATEYSGTGKVLCMNDLFSSYASDVIMTYAFNRSYGFLDRPDFISPFTNSIQGLKNFVHVAQQFPWLPHVLRSLPDGVVSYLQPSMQSVLYFQSEMKTQVLRMLRNRETGSDNEQLGTIFYELGNSGLPPEDLEVSRLKDEAMSIVGAGIETTKMANVVTCFHIINKPRIMQRLQQELKNTIPNPQSPPPLSILENLPYLGACIQEGIRLSYGAIARSQRISRHAPLHYGDWTIPPNVMVSLDTYHMHHDESVFPDSFTFKPERWLNNPRGPDSQKNLARYLVSFGRGTRMCVGFNLAYAEITLVLAALFRCFDFDLYETSRSDVDCYRDMIGLEVAPESNGVTVTVR